MAEDERLREALLELQFLREREAASLSETRKLLDCLEAYSAAATPGEALSSIFVMLGNTIDADLSLLVEMGESGACSVLASSDRALTGCTLVPPYDLSLRARDILDLGMLEPWGGEIDMNQFTALQSVPLRADGTVHALLVLKKPPTRFEKGSIRLVERLAGLAARALQGIKFEKENKLLAAAIHGSSAGFAIADATQAECPLIYVNEAFEQISGYRAAEVLGINCRFLSAEAPGSPERARLRKAVKDRAPGQFLLRNRRKDGTLFWNELTLFPVRNDAGEAVSLVATQTDVSARVEAAAERDRTRAQMARALTATEDGFLVLETDLSVAFCNDATRDIFPAPDVDWQVGTAFDANWAAFLSASRDMPGRITALLRQPDFDGLTRLPNGREIDLPDGRTVLVRASDLSDGALVISATDVTPMKAAQRLLSQRLAAIEAAQDGIAVTDDSGRLTYLNGAASAMLGYRDATLALGQYWYDSYDPARGLQGRKAFDEILLHRSDQTALTHAVTGTALESGGSVIIIRDITDRLAFEAREEELKAGLQHLQRQQAISQLAAGVAHDFNNLLSAINGSATLIGIEKELPETLKTHVDRISTAGSQAARLVNRLLDVGATGEGKGAFDLHSVLADVPSLVAPSLPDGIDLLLTEDSDIGALAGDPGALSQVVVNLVLNARDAISSDQGQIAVSAGLADAKGAACVQVGELLASQAYARIDIADTGDGIAQDRIETVFEPYFSTKGRDGTGLGLAMVALQVQGIGGAVGISSAVGRGTTVSVYWPLETRDTVARAGNPRDSYDLSGQLIIVLDDDADVATVIAKYLEAQGAEVAICIDPRDAIEALEDDPDLWTALVTDYDMPLMSGGDVAEKAKVIAPHIPVILVTALARRLSDPRVKDGTIHQVLAKPVDLNHLSSVLFNHRKTDP